jgi:hypothetical protein
MGDPLGPGFLGSLFGLFQGPAAARLIKKAHDGQDGTGGDDHPFGPHGGPPKDGHNDNGRGQQEPAETKFHVIPSYIIRIRRFYRKTGPHSKVKT